MVRGLGGVGVWEGGDGGFEPKLKVQLKQCFLRKTMSPQPSSFVSKIMVLSYGDHLSNNILWAQMVIGRNCYGPKWSWTKMIMGQNIPGTFI